MPTATHSDLLPVPVKRYFSLEEAAQLAGVDAETFRAWEAEFADSAVPAGGRRSTGVKKYWRPADCGAGCWKAPPAGACRRGRTENG